MPTSQIAKWLVYSRVQYANLMKISKPNNFMSLRIGLHEWCITTIMGLQNGSLNVRVLYLSLTLCIETQNNTNK